MSELFRSEVDLTSVDLDGYCGRIGYTGPREPTLPTLRALHRLHPAAIPFETIDVRLGLGIELDAKAVDAKLIAGQRGGYCFEQNTLFLRVLRALGFDAEPLIARSRWGRPLEISHPRTHLAVRVRLDGTEWLADVGFGGCMLTAPLRMDVRDAQQTTHEPARLTPAGDDLRLERLLGGIWTPVCDVSLTRQEPCDLMAANWIISAHPASPFHHRLVLSRTRDDVRHMLVDTRLTVRRQGGAAEQHELNADQIAHSLADDFGLPVQPGWRALFQDIAAQSPTAPAASRSSVRA